MPLKRICKATGCCRLVDPSTGHKYCLEHQALERKEQEERMKNRPFYPHARHNAWPQLYNSPKWKTLRAKKFEDNPLCEICGAPATEVHHIRAHNGDPDLFYDYDNLMSICHSSHVRETQKESEERKKNYTKRDRRKLWY